MCDRTVDTVLRISIGAWLWWGSFMESRGTTWSGRAPPSISDRKIVLLSLYIDTVKARFGEGAYSPHSNWKVWLQNPHHSLMCGSAQFVLCIHRSIDVKIAYRRRSWARWHHSATVTVHSGITSTLTQTYTLDKPYLCSRKNVDNSIKVKVSVHGDSNGAQPSCGLSVREPADQIPQLHSYDNVRSHGHQRDWREHDALELTCV